MIIQRNKSFYEKYIKRFLDILCALCTIILFSWLYIAIAIVVRIKMGAPIFFKQQRPGMLDKDGTERIFTLYKFRTMTNEKDKKGNLLSDEKRLSKFGKMLRLTSLDELPEVYNILKGDMSVIGPRPQLVKDLVFMSESERLRHTAKPGLSGLAQVNGRNAVTWEEKFKYDLMYIANISFVNDLKILWLTIKKFIQPNAVDKSETDIALDYGEWLLKEKRITQVNYNSRLKLAEDILALHAKEVNNG